jgi:hypothetical protein
VTVEVLLPGTVSVTPLGTVTAAVFTIVFVKFAGTVKVIVNVIALPEVRVINVLMSPLPLEAH